MPIVRSRLCDHAHMATHPAIFRRDDALDDLYFTNGFGAHHLNFGEVAIHAEHLRTRIAACAASVHSGAHRAAAESIQLVTRAAHGVGSEIVPAQARPAAAMLVVTLRLIIGKDVTCSAFSARRFSGDTGLNCAACAV